MIVVPLLTFRTYQIRLMHEELVDKDYDETTVIKGS